MRLPLADMADAERWIAWIRLAVVAFIVVNAGLVRERAAPEYEAVMWATTAVFAAGAVVIWLLAHREWERPALERLGLGALALDTVAVSIYVVVYASEPGTPVRLALLIPVIEGAFRYGLLGGIVLPFALAPSAVGFEWIRSGRDDDPFQPNFVVFPVGIQIVSGLVVGWLVRQLHRTTATAQHRAEEAERLRDELGHRVDLLEAANRCSRALGSSLDLQEAFGAFIGELRSLIPFERLAIVLADGGVAEVMASAGRGADTIFPPGTRRPVEGSVLERVLAGRVAYREDMADSRHPEETALLELGLRCRVVAPLLSGPRAIGMLSIVREEPSCFSQEEIELITLLGHLLATGVQNIRAYEAERNTVEELRRLSALRADFVSLVSHELRSPMASVIGSARTLQERWRELSPEHREAFLALIADETTRLADLIGDVLDTSRIEAGTFSFSFATVDVGELVRDAVSSARLGQDEVPLAASVRDGLPPVRGDRERLRQVLTNLVDNAVKYSPTGSEVRVSAYLEDSRVRVDVVDEGPGIAAEHHKLIFEKFGRAKPDGAKPGTGLGLFIARSIAEAHGGRVEVRSAPGRGSTFTLSLPAEAR